MRGRLIIAMSCLLLSGATHADAQPEPLDLKTLPDTIKQLKWQAIDWAALPSQERCRALLLLNDSLDQIAAASSAEADLMSQFIDEEAMGPDFVAFAPPTTPEPLSYESCTKVATAMLRGPMSSSSYAGEFVDATDEHFLRCTEELYDTTCQRKWNQTLTSKRQAFWMSEFLRAQQRMDAYQAWAPGEVERREQAFQEELAQKRAQAQVEGEAQRAAVKAEYEAEQARSEQEQAERAQQMQQAIAAAQSSQGMGASGGVVYDDDDDDYPYWYYGGMTRLGTAAYYRDGAYRGAADARVERRMTSWNRAGRAGGGRGGRGGGGRR